MRTPLGKRPPTVTAGNASKRQLVLAGVLLIGVLVLGYGYFQRSSIALDLGLLVIAAGVLSGIVQNLRRGNE